MASEPKKLSLEQLLHLVDQLSAAEQETLRRKLNAMADKQAFLVGEPHPFLDWRINLDALAEQQGIPESTSVEGLKGDFCPADEDMDEFVTTLRQWRHEGGGQN
ncbi:MAG: hypothetical protein IT342_10070 [Candidatus Melainabacteria bacterium]|nr:hypothetical protein [Candidatus Melainabacteria bacterium]